MDALARRDAVTIGLTPSAPARLRADLAAYLVWLATETTTERVAYARALRAELRRLGIETRVAVPMFAPVGYPREQTLRARCERLAPGGTLEHEGVTIWRDSTAPVLLEVTSPRGRTVDGVFLDQIEPLVWRMLNPPHPDLVAIQRIRDGSMPLLCAFSQRCTCGRWTNPLEGCRTCRAQAQACDGFRCSACSWTGKRPAESEAA